MSVMRRRIELPTGQNTDPQLDALSEGDRATLEYHSSRTGETMTTEAVVSEIHGYNGDVTGFVASDPDRDGREFVATVRRRLLKSRVNGSKTGLGTLVAVHCGVEQ